MPDKIIAHIDGGSRGNPGPAAAGFTLTDSAGTQLQAKAFFLGQATNNVAEYTSLVKALEAAKQIGAEQLTIFSDSELLVRQINGQYKVKSELIRPFFRQAVSLLGEFENWRVRHITREKNEQADKLVNQALNLGSDIENEPELAVQNQKPIRLGVLISGGGTTLMNIFKYIKRGDLNAEIAIVIASKKCKGVDRARAAGLNVKIEPYREMIHFKNHDPTESLFQTTYSDAITFELTKAHVKLVILAGFLSLYRIPKIYENKVMNIHPALLPSFGGQGMWGHRVHEAVLKAGCKVSGCTVHYCTDEYDKGPIIDQKYCRVEENDTPDTLAARVFKKECILYPRCIQYFAEGSLYFKNGVVKIKK